MGDTPKRPNARDRVRAKRSNRPDVDEGVAEVLKLMPADAAERRKAKQRRVPPPARAPMRERSPQSRVELGDDSRGKMRITLGKRWTQVVQEIRKGEYTWQEFCDGLDPEELARAQLKDSKGGWMGRPPAFVPREFHLQCQRELRRRFDEKMQLRLLKATDEYIRMSRKVEDAALREKMLRYIMERVMGPIPRTIEVSTAPKHEGFLAAVIRSEGAMDYSKRYDRRTEDAEDEVEEDG
jgi:hypothetical protein